MNQPEFTLYLVRSDNDGNRIERFHGGSLDNPYGQAVQGIYLTETEAKHHAPELMANRGRILSAYPPGLYQEPVAWLVTHIILMHSTGEGKLHVEPTYGGECYWNDDRDVMAIFQSRSGAEAYAASDS